MKNIYTLFLCFLIISCNGQSEKQNIKYQMSLSEFDARLVGHFPKKITTYPREIINSKNIGKNSVGFMLYEYNAANSVIDSLENILKNGDVTHYRSNDSCLLIVNRFETLESYENLEDVKINDTSKVNNPCHNNLLPIPNFIDYKYPNKLNEINLTEKFDIYVIDAKEGNYFKEFNLKPNPQMPNNWRNGYSRGIAINREENIVIYWGIIW